MLQPSLLALLILPLPKPGVLVPVSITVAADVAADVEDGAALAEKAAMLEETVCQHSLHVRLVKDPAAAAVILELESYDQGGLGQGSITQHHFRGRFYIQGKWEPFESWSTFTETPPHLESLAFVERLIFDADTIQRERLEARKAARGRQVPRSAADIARCLPR